MLVRTIVCEEAGLATFSVEIVASWDAEAAVWTAVSKDVPGLVTEGATVEAVIERAKAVIPELLELNEINIGKRPVDIPIHVIADYRESVRVPAHGRSRSQT